MSAMDRSEISREGVTGVTYRAALGQRTILRLNGFASYGNDREDETSSNALGLGGRIEFTCKL